MIKNSKLLALCLTFTAVAAFGDAANRLLSFYTNGPDRYADGTTVLDREWYALVWSPDGEFGGVDVNLEPLRDGDRVVLMAPLAKNGRCPYTVFQIDSQSSDNRADGKYAIYMLDTRNVTLSSPSAADAQGKPKLVNGLAPAKEYTAEATDAAGAVAGGSAWAESSDDTLEEDMKRPRITGFRLVNGRIELKVADMLPNVKYNVQMGATPDRLDTYGLQFPKVGEGEETTFELDPEDAKFFQIKRQKMEVR